MSHKINLGNKSPEQSCEIHPNLNFFSGYGLSRLVMSQQGNLSLRLSIIDDKFNTLLI